MVRIVFRSPCECFHIVILEILLQKGYKCSVCVHLFLVGSSGIFHRRVVFHLRPHSQLKQDRVCISYWEQYDRYHIETGNQFRTISTRNIHCTLLIKQWLLEVLGTQTTQIKCAYLWYIENYRFLFILSFSDFGYTSCRILYTIMQTPAYDINVTMGLIFANS